MNNLGLCNGFGPFPIQTFSTLVEHIVFTGFPFHKKLLISQSSTNNMKDQGLRTKHQPPPPASQPVNVQTYYKVFF